jgi:hypothetical protein
VCVCVCAGVGCNVCGLGTASQYASVVARGAKGKEGRKECRAGGSRAER